MIEGNDEAEDYMLRPPSGVTSCYTLRGDQHLPGGRFYSNMDEAKRARIYLATSKEHIIRLAMLVCILWQCTVYVTGTVPNCIFRKTTVCIKFSRCINFVDLWISCLSTKINLQSNYVYT